MLKNVKNFVLFLIIILFFCAIFPFGNDLLALANKILKTEIFYITANFDGTPNSIKFVSLLKWEKGKNLQLKSKIPMINLKPLNDQDPVTVTGDTMNIGFRESNVVTLQAALDNTFSLPVTLNVKYYFNDKEIKPVDLVKNKDKMNGELRIEFYVKSNQTITRDITYTKFPENKSVTIQQEVTIPYLILLTTESQISLATFDDIIVTSGVKTFEGENIRLSIIMIPYPEATASITFKGNLAKIPNLLLTCNPLSIDIPKIFMDKILEFDNKISETFDNYLKLKEFVQVIIDSEEQVINLIDNYYKMISTYLPQIASFTDLINFYISNLERVMKLNRIFVDILDQMKSYIGIDDPLYQQIKQLFDLNNMLISITLEGMSTDSGFAPGLYYFPELITAGETTAVDVQDSLIQFKEASALIKEKLSQSKELFESYEGEVYKLINDFRIEKEKILKILNFSSSMLDYILFIQPLDDKNITMDKNIQFIYKFSFDKPVN